MVYGDLAQRLIGPTGVIRRPAPYALCSVRGPDAVDFLHRMCSQDIAGMGDGEVRSGAFLDAKGRLLVTTEIARSPDTVWLSTQVHLVAALLAMLERFHFTEELTIVDHQDLACADILATAPLPSPSLLAGRCEATAGGGLVLAGVRHGVHWSRRHGSVTELEPWLATVAPATAAAASIDQAECLRFVLREPCVGTDSEPNTLALELPIDDHISTTKGCYTGQEIVARIHTYGHTNRSLCLLVVEATEPIEASTPIVETADGDAVGRLMSSARWPGEPRRLAFGFLPNDFTTPGTVLALGAADGARVVVV